MGTNGTVKLTDKETTTIPEEAWIDQEELEAMFSLPPLKIVVCTTEGCDRAAEFCECGECDPAEVICGVCENVYSSAYESGWRAGRKVLANELLEEVRADRQ